MALDPKDNVVIRLVIKGADPAQAAEAAQQSAAAVEQALRASLQRQTQLYASSYAELTAEGRQAAETVIKEERVKIGQLAALSKQLSSAEAQAARDTTNVMRKERAAGQAAVQASYAAVLNARRALTAAESAEDRKAAAERVSSAEEASRQVVASFNHMKEEHAAATQGMSSNWHRTMEDLENITTVVTGVIGVVTGGYDRMKAFGEEIIRTTQIYNSQHVDISAAREAISGTATDLELIGAANLATEKDLHLTGEEFAAVAKQAKKFADAIGIDSKEALNNLVDGLALGKTKMLAHAGVIIDVTKAQREYAKSLDIEVESLTDEDKARAIQIAGLDRLKSKMMSAQDDQKNLSDVMEQGFAGVKTAWDDLVASIGSWKPPEWFLKAISSGGKLTRAERAEKIAATGRALGISDENIQGSIDAQLGPETAEDRQQDALIRLKREADKARAENARMRAEAVARGEAPPDESYTIGNGIAGSHGIAGSGRGREKFEYGPDEKVDPLKGMDLFWASVADRTRLALKLGPSDGMSEAATAEYQAWQDAIKEAFGDKSLLTEEQKAAILAEPGSELAASILTQAAAQKGFNTAADAVVEQQKFGVRTFAGGKYTDKEIGDFSKGQAGGVVTLADQKAEAEAIKAQYADIGRTTNDNGTQGGPGLVEMMMFGPSGAPDTLRSKMDEATKITYDATKQMHEQMESLKMATEGALGSSLAAAMGENKNFKAALKDTEHAVLMSISAQSFAKSLFFAAEALGDFAMGNFAKSAADGLAALKYAAVGAAVGVAAHATYTPPSTTGPSVGSTPTETRPSVSSGSGSSSDSGGRSITFNINAPLGDAVAVGRAMDEAFEKYRQQTGREIGARR